jgi:TonB family protein
MTAVLRWMLASFAACAVNSVAAQETPVRVEAAPGWVVPITPALERKTDGAIDFRLLDVQTRVEDGVVHSYYRQILRILTPEGLAAAGNFFIVWKPGISSAEVHRATIRRGDQVIDVLNGGRNFQILRREANLDKAQLDGVLTALMPISDLRVGDEIETSWSARVADPVLKGLAEYENVLPGGVNIGRLHVRNSWKPMQSISFRLGTDVPKVTMIDGSGVKGFIVDRTNFSLPPVPDGAPKRFGTNGLVALSAFSDWQAVATAMRPLYQSASQLRPDSKIVAEIDRISKISTDPGVRASEALRLVQRDVRYFARTDGLGGYQPESADAVWSARAGDCKGKTVLLLALLKGLGIEAQAALVSATRSDGIEASLPMAGRFDHVIVQAKIGGKTYWLDGTRLGDRTIDTAIVPEFRFALPVATGQGLVAVAATDPPLPLDEWRLDLDARAGRDKPTKATATAIFRSDKASELRALMGFMSSEQRDAFMRKAWSDRHDWITIDTIGQSYDETTGNMTLTMSGSGKMDWDENAEGETKKYEANKARLGQSIKPNRPDALRNKAPVAVAPQFSATRQTILLPDQGRGYVIEGEDIDVTTGGISYRRTATLKDGRFDMAATTKSVASETSYADAEAADKETDDIFAKRLFISLPAKPQTAVRTASSTGKAMLVSGSISDSDYPAAAVRASEQGTAAATFTIDANGRVSQCLVTVSSGSQALDTQTCTLIRERFVFQPARDRRGRAIAEERTQRVTWRLPEGETPMFASGSSVVTFTIGLDGAARDCKFEISPPPKKMPGDVECAGLSRKEPLRGPDGKPAIMRVTMRQSITTEVVDPPKQAQPNSGNPR